MGTTSEQRRAAAAALGLIAAAGVAVVLAFADGGADQQVLTDPAGTAPAPMVPEITNSTLVAPTPDMSGQSGVIPIDDSRLRGVGLALFGEGNTELARDDEVVLVGFDGRELGRGLLAGWYTNHPDRGVDLDMTVGGVVVTAAPAIDDPVPGCDAVHGAGGVRAAVCGSGARPTEIRLVAADGTSRMLAGPVADVGHWRFALPSPDGKWVLAQWSAECEVPVAYLFEVATRERRPAGTDDSSRSVAIAWAPDGRAVVGLGPGPCGGSGDEPGTYLLDPRSRDRERLHPHTSGARIAHLNGWRLNRLERVFDRAREELGLEGCCFEPSHGGDDVDDGIVLDGHDIYVRAAPLSAPPAPPEPGELRFTCGQARYILSWFLDPRPDGRLLERAADLLVPHLYCTRGTNEHG